MRPVARVIGWLLMGIGAVVIVGIVWGVASGRIPGNFLAGLLMCAPVVLVMIFGAWLARKGKPKEIVSTGAPVWTRRGPA